MAHDPVELAESHSPGEDTDTLAPAITPAGRGHGERRLLLGLLLVGLCTGAIIGRHYSSVAGDASPPAAAQRLLRLVTPPTPEAEITFSTTDARPAATPDLLPAGAPTVYVSYDLPGAKSAELPRVKWSRDGKPQPPVPPDAMNPDEGGRRAGMVSLAATGGKLTPGIYEVELAFGGEKFAASFVCAWGAEAIAGQAAPSDAEAAISEMVTAAAIKPDGSPLRPQKSFPGNQRVYAVFHFAKAEPGSAVLVKWYGGEQVIPSATREVILPAAEGHANAWLEAPFTSPLPPGTYRAVVTMVADDKALATARFAVVAPVPPATDWP